MKDINELLFKVKVARRQPAAGALLVADPFMSREYFNHGVTSVIDYEAGEGATGVVLNQRTEYTLDELIDGVDAATQIPVYCGGPTGQDRMFFIHTLGPDIIPQARPYAPGLYVGGDFDAALAYVNGGFPVEGCLRFFVGYSNWAEGQLEREIANGQWANIAEAIDPVTLLTGDGDHYWHTTVAALGERFRGWQLLPRNPVCN